MKTIHDLTTDGAVRLAADELAEVVASIASVRERMAAVTSNDAEAKAERQMLGGRLERLLERRANVAAEHREAVGSAAGRAVELAAGEVVCAPPEQMRDAAISALVIATLAVECGHGHTTVDRPGLSLAGQMRTDDPGLAELVAQRAEDARQLLNM